MIDLKGSTAAISGAGSGIGRGLALKAAARGARVAVIDIQPEAAAETVALIAEAGGEARAYEGDVTDLDAMHTLAARIEAEFGRIHIVFNNAGVFTGGTLAQTKPQDFAWVFDVNVRGLYNAVQAFQPALERAAAAGELAWMVNTGSENSLGLPTMAAFTAYTATKHAVLAMSDGLRRDLAPLGIRVAVFCPGAVQTNIWNAKRTRQERFGGAREAPAENAAGLADGRTIEATADAVFEGLDAGEFIIVTDPRMRSFAGPRLEEIARALDVADARITTL